MTILVEGSEEFALHIVKDERSYDHHCLQKAGRLLVKHGKVASARNYEIMVRKLHEISESAQDIDELLTNPPDEFICPLSCDIMRDPILLPTSGNICERSWMQRVVLNDGMDPFNRKPLTEKAF